MKMAKRAWQARVRTEREERELLAAEVQAMAANVLVQAREAARARAVAERQHDLRRHGAHHDAAVAWLMLAILCMTSVLRHSTRW